MNAKKDFGPQSLIFSFFLNPPFASKWYLAFFHKHIEDMHPHIYHGFYCANVEPSTTTYRIGPEQPENEWIVHQDYNALNHKRVTS